MACGLPGCECQYCGGLPHRTRAKRIVRPLLSVALFMLMLIIGVTIARAKLLGTFKFPAMHAFVHRG